MIESITELQSRLEGAIISGFRNRLFDRGLARGLIWRNGILPPGSPSFAENLTEDLLDYGHAVLAMALRLRSQDNEHWMLSKSFLIAGESIEAAVHREDKKRIDRAFHCVSAAVAFHLARYAARAYSILPLKVRDANLASTETVIVYLLKRYLDDMHTQVATWLLNENHIDEKVAQRLLEDVKFDETDAIHEVLTSSIMRSLAFFGHAITTGENQSAVEAKNKLLATVKAARDTHAVSHWWTATLALQLIDELWKLSFHQQIPILSSDDEYSKQWNFLRWSYIQLLRSGERAAIEFWPSQLEAVHRAVDHTDNLVIALPTSAGKTRIAELCIMRALALNQRIVYVTPLRALVAQVERDLSKIFQPLGFNVSLLYGSAGIESGDKDTLSEGKIVVSTPEKLDFALRNDPSIIEDVGLIVLDEGHMLGPSEREVRYEALVQRLLRRKDSESRRIICLSALFPSPEDMEDLVGWIRQDMPGKAIHSMWRPTRHRYGTLRWLSGKARLDIKIEDEKSFVPRFIKPCKPSMNTRRRLSFPKNKNELTLATAWNFVKQEKDVLVYCSLRVSVEALGKLVLKCIEQGVLEPLKKSNSRLQNAMTTGAEWLGFDHPAVQCLQFGIALHHGGLPRPFLNDVEGLLRSRDCPLTIASPTLAQGLNLSASVLLVPSIWRNQKIIPVNEFANVAGRAGRAFVDVEGLIIHIIWKDDEDHRKWAVEQWETLIKKAKAPKVISGLLQLAYLIFRRIALACDLSLGEVLEYITGYGEAWDLTDSAAKKIDVKQIVWERDIASLDAAILALLDSETEEEKLDIELDEVLKGSLFSRQLNQVRQDLQTQINGFIKARTRWIWSQTDDLQRKGYHVAGVGLRAGHFLNNNIKILVELMISIEEAIIKGNSSETADFVINFAEIIFQTAPFSPKKVLPNTWKDALRAWIEGHPASHVVSISGKFGVDLLQDTFTYRLPWAMEAVRVHSNTIDSEWANQLRGLAALAVEVGSANRSVITLLRNGLSSRVAAKIAVDTTAASFYDHTGMKDWLWSDEVVVQTTKHDWPTAQSRHAWLQFWESQNKIDRQEWIHETQNIEVEWFNEVPDSGTHVIVEPDGGRASWIVLTPDFMKLGHLKFSLYRSCSEIVRARVDKNSKGILVEYFGPQT